MNQSLLAILAYLIFLFSAVNVSAQGAIPELVYYKFDQTGDTILNEASNPPVGADTAFIIGGQSQGGVGLCQTGLIGTGGLSNVDYVDTGWDLNLGTGAWTIAFWTDNFPNSNSMFHQFGDPATAALRCFANGQAGPGNLMLRGSFPPVLCTGCAPVGTPSMTAFVYDPVAGNIKAYHDGVLNNTVPQGTLTISGTDFKVGAFAGSLGLASGQIMDEFRVYDRALDSLEILYTYNDCLPLVFANNAGVANISQPTNLCVGTEDVVVTIENYGSNQIDSCIVQWEVDAVPQPPFYFYGLLDTIGGVGPTSAQVTIGSTFFNLAVTEIKAWTELPNGMVDIGTINDTSLISIEPSISGNLTIGGIAPDYVDFTSAIADLSLFGVCGPTIFDVRSGIYNEQISLDSIPGSSASNTILFRSEVGDRDSVTISYSSINIPENYTVRFNGADYVAFEQMTMEATGTNHGHVMVFDGDSDYNTVSDCHLLGVPLPGFNLDYAVLFSFSHDDDHNSFLNNTIENGSHNVIWIGNTSQEDGNVFDGNEMLNAYRQAALLGTQNGLVFTNNTIIASNSSPNPQFIGLRFDNCYDGMLVKDNRVVIGPDIHGMGMYFISCYNSSTNPGMIINNMISVGSFSTQTSGSMGINVAQSTHLNFHNNSVSVKSNTTDSWAFVVGDLNSHTIESKNNSFVVDGYGYAALYSSNYTVTASDYNNFYTTGPNLMTIDGAVIPTLADCQALLGLDSNSISTDPYYQSFENLHICSDSLNGAGIPLTSVLDDIDGQPRDTSNPDIGADEFGTSTAGYLGPDTNLCTGEVITLWAGSPFDDILWSTGDTLTSIDVTSPGTYSVQVIGDCGNGYDTIVIDSAALIYTNFVDADTTFFCLPGLANLTSSQSGTSYLWSTSDTTQNIVVTAGGTYTLNLQDECGSGIDSVIVVGASVPIANFTSSTSYLTSFFTNMTVADGTVTYNWDFGDSNSSTDENPTHIYNTAGTYFVTLTVTNECGTATYSDSVTVSTVGLEEILNGNSFALYPNPNTGSFTLEFPSGEYSPYDIIISNEIGQVIYTVSSNESSGGTMMEIDLVDVKSGLYFITVVLDDIPYVSKFVVTHE